MGLGGTFRFVEGSGDSSERYKDDFIHDVWTAANWNSMIDKIFANMKAVENEYNTKEQDLADTYERKEWVRDNYVDGVKVSSTYNIYHHRQRTFDTTYWKINSNTLATYYATRNPGNTRTDISDTERENSLVSSEKYTGVASQLTNQGYSIPSDPPYGAGDVIMHQHPINLENALTDFFSLSGVDDFDHTIQEYWDGQVTE